MKKLFALLLTLALLLGSAAMAEYDYTGLWTLIGMETAGISMDVSALGLNASLLLNEDGTCVLTMQDETRNGTWAATATRTGITTTDAEGVVDTYKLMNKNLVAEQEGVKFIYAREVKRAINYVGTWTLTDLEVNGVPQEPSALGISGGMVLIEDDSCVLSLRDESGAEMLGVRVDLRIRDGKCHVELVRDGVTEVYDAICMLSEIEFVSTMVYFHWINPATDKLTGDGMSLMLLSDGRLFWEFFGEAGNRAFYCFENAANVPE